MEWTEPLNLQYWLLNVLSGDPKIFIVVAFLFIAVVAGIFKMINFSILLLFIIFTIMVNTSIAIPDIYMIVILLAGLITAYSISKIVKN
jgi:hypothetical protein